MNLPSFDKFIDTVVPGGIAIIDSTLVPKKVERDDISAYYVPATALAEEKGLKGLANIILMGKMLGLTNFCSMETMQKTIEKVVPPRKQHLIPRNMEAIELGMNS
jgi:2-oxoglutarate ferredoxin oxidoreductase subunit gamma